MDSRKKLLIILSIIWAGLIAYRLMPAERPAPKASRVGARELPELRFDLLETKRPEYGGIKKDIFSPFKKPEAKPVAPKPTPVAAVPVVAPPPPPQPPPPLPSPLQVFSTQVSFVGFVEKGASRKVFLSRGPDVFVVKKGDLIEGRFGITEINDSFIQFDDPVSGETVSINLERK